MIFYCLINDILWKKEVGTRNVWTFAKLKTNFDDKKLKENFRGIKT